MTTGNDNYDPDKDLLADVIEDALEFTPTNDPDEPRDPGWLRWSKFAAIIFGCAFLVGAVFGFEDYVEQYSAPNDFQRTRAERRVEHDSMGELKFRLLLGGGIGAAVGGFYVVRCLVRRVDP